MAISRNLQANGEHATIGVKGRSGAEERFDLADYATVFTQPGKGISRLAALGAYIKTKRNNTVTEINELNGISAENTENKEAAKSAVSSAILHEIGDSLRQLEAKMLAADFSFLGIGLNGGEDKRALARFAASRFIRERLQGETERLLALPEVTAAELKKSVNTVEEICGWDPEKGVYAHATEYRKFSTNQPEIKKILTQSSFLLHPTWIALHLNPEDNSPPES